MKRLSIILFACIFCLNLTARPRITHGPWVSNVNDTSFTVNFTLDKDAMVWVEVAPDDGTTWYKYKRERFYDSELGRRIASKYHSVAITGLEPGTKYRYRITAEEMIPDSTEYYKIRYIRGKVLRKKGSKATDFNGIRTFNRSADTCRFSMTNDIHFADSIFTTLFKGTKSLKPDFILLNGDIVSYSKSEEDVLSHHIDPIENWTPSYPIVLARGNHESRGKAFSCYRKYFAGPNGQLYYTFRQGPVGFIVLDAGEDKPDDDVEYYGTGDYDQYRTKELEWLKVAVKDPDFASAPKKVCIIHIPTINDNGSWYTQTWISEHFMPILNEAGIDLMLSAHLHRYLYRKVGEFGNKYPVVVNKNCERLDFVGTAGSIKLDMYDSNGKKTHSLQF